jgi:hypothetical protein
MGLLSPDDWRAVWIEAESLLRHEFTVDRPVVKARLYATARGLYEAFVNGRRVGDAGLTPGFTQYGARLQVQAFDVTPLIRTGRNTVAATVAGTAGGSASCAPPASGATGSPSWRSYTSPTPTARRRSSAPAPAGRAAPATSSRPT